MKGENGIIERKEASEKKCRKKNKTRTIVKGEDTLIRCLNIFCWVLGEERLPFTLTYLIECH